LPWEDHVFTLFGRTVPMPRRIAMFGPFPYAYSGLVHPVRPLPAALASLGETLGEQLGQPFNSVLANLYRDGRDSMGWHADADYEGLPLIASVSLGASRRLLVRARRGEGRWSIELPHGSVFVMEEGFQQQYLHSVPKVGAVGLRVNLTFRHMARSNVRA
jgi:alkylated DNA repair dioxygenase AlkB